MTNNKIAHFEQLLADQIANELLEKSIKDGSLDKLRNVVYLSLFEESKDMSGGFSRTSFEKIGLKICENIFDENVNSLGNLPIKKDVFSRAKALVGKELAA